MKKILKQLFVICMLVISVTSCSEISKQPQNSVKQDEDANSSTKSEGMIETDTGRYQGMADNNFFEVKISGVPEDSASKVFMITDDVRTKFEELNLKKDEVIKIKFSENKDGQFEVFDIERVIN